MPKPRKLNQPVPSSISTPESLARDVSDLSGSYIFGSRSLEPPRGDWRQGHELDTPLTAADSTLLTLRLKRRRVTSTKTPVLLVLIDSPRRIFEIIRLFIDSEIDSAKNIVDMVQGSIPDRWKPSCNSIFQKRGITYTQLINILKLRKYDIQPNEILIGKPMYMTSRQTMSAANGIMGHLTDLGFLRVNGYETSALDMSSFIFQTNAYNTGAKCQNIETQQSGALQNAVESSKGSETPFRLDKIAEVLHLEGRSVAPTEEKILKRNESAISAILSILDCCYISPKVATPVDYTYGSKGGKGEGYCKSSFSPLRENRRFADGRRCEY